MAGISVDFRDSGVGPNDGRQVQGVIEDGMIVAAAWVQGLDVPTRNEKTSVIFRSERSIRFSELGECDCASLLGGCLWRRLRGKFVHSLKPQRLKPLGTVINGRWKALMSAVEMGQQSLGYLHCSHHSFIAKVTVYQWLSKRRTSSTSHGIPLNFPDARLRAAAESESVGSKTR